MSKTIATPWIANRIITFFNAARQVGDLLDGTIQDDPADGAGRTLGPTLAGRILRERNQLPQRRFTSVAQLDNIRGVGEGTLKDLAYSFGVPAAAAFQQSMYDNNVLFRDNWPLEHFRTTIDDEAAFRELVSDEKQFRQWVHDKVRSLCSARDVKKQDAKVMLGEINKAYIDTYHNTTPAPGYALALWFYEFDADNWFSWERIQAETDKYINYHMGGFPWEMELRFFRGVRQRGIIPVGITPADLPVMVNWPERAITIWFSTLYD